MVPPCAPLVAEVKPDLIIPEIEAIATDTPAALRQEGVKVVPNARATQLTMNREGIRRLAAETLGLPTSAYRFAQSKEGLWPPSRAIGLPCVVKPVMSSSGKGAEPAARSARLDESWTYAQEGAVPVVAR